MSTLINDTKQHIQSLEDTQIIKMLSENFGITLDTVIDDFRMRIVQLACFNYEQNLAFIVSKKTVIILKEIEQFIH